MRILFAIGLVCAANTLVQCKSRKFNNNSGVKNATAAEGVKQVDPKAFNAFKIWRDGKGAEILDYPQGYDVSKRNTTPDDVFYVLEQEYYDKDKSEFTGVPTEGAKVVSDVLEYPVKNGMQLKLKFTMQAQGRVFHSKAAKECQKQGLRLPTVRELFDFCAAGVTGPLYGPNYAKRPGAYPIDARCGNKSFWSASLNSTFPESPWYFLGGLDGDNKNGYVSSLGNRDYAEFYFWCVSPAQ